METLEDILNWAKENYMLNNKRFEQELLIKLGSIS